MYCVGRLFDDLAVSGKWHSPPRYERAFRVRWGKLAADDDEQLGADDENDEIEQQEANAEETETFNIAEIEYLWRTATPFERLLLGLGLFCGFHCHGYRHAQEDDGGKTEVTTC